MKNKPAEHCVLQYPAHRDHEYYPWRSKSVLVSGLTKWSGEGEPSPGPTCWDLDSLLYEAAGYKPGWKMVVTPTSAIHPSIQQQQHQQTEQLTISLIDLLIPATEQLCQQRQDCTVAALGACRWQGATRLSPPTQYCTLPTLRNFYSFSINKFIIHTWLSQLNFTLISIAKWEKLSHLNYSLSTMQKKS